MTMFHTARLKLTAWYLAIIMTISLSFSLFIYRIITLDFQRRLNTIERRLELHRFGFFPPPGETHFFIADLEETRKRLLFILLYTNGTIFLFSALAGYFLAGKTLEPIETALDEQKRFVADASHELKTPLTSLQTAIEVSLRDKKLNLKNARTTLSESLDDIEKLKSLTGNLLTLAKHQENGAALTKEEFDLKEIVNKIEKELLPFAKKKKIEMTIQAPSLKIQTNKESLGKIISLLLDNAIKYTLANGRVLLKVQKEKKHLTIEVSDTGMGIDKKHLPHIFDRFYRVDTSRTKEDDSSFGLGLSLAKKYVEMNNGEISVKSPARNVPATTSQMLAGAGGEIGKGSTFLVKIPLS